MDQFNYCVSHVQQGLEICVVNCAKRYCLQWHLNVSTRAKKCPAWARPGRPGLALPGPGRPGPAIAGLGQPRPENWPGPAWPWPARAG